MISHNPLISVVLASYNGSKYIEEQIKSILQQSYSPVELIIVDDASSDHTVSIIRQFESSYSCIKVFTNEENVGYIKNFEKGMLLATGDYIALSDQDDIWEPEKLCRLVEEIGKHDLIYSDSLLIYDNGLSMKKKLSDVKRLVDFDDCLCYTIGGSVPGHAMLISQRLIRECYPFPAGIPHDYWIGFVATCRGTMKFLPEPLVRYRQHHNNIAGIPGSPYKQLHKNRENETDSAIRSLIRLLYEKCPAELPQKAVLGAIAESYGSFSLQRNFRRVQLFFQNYEKILSFKKKPVWKKWLFCLKMFVMIK
ncbi:MAG TPA: glycosyltransferase family 2 protein [Flavitalea sp.]|nr:glycosyltransferase family 2 protein [Flavitalea sp.]